MTQLSAHDVVPVFQPKDFGLSGSPAGVGDDLLKVHSLESGQTFELRGFEYSLARMLDGRRTAEEVLTGAAQLGLPLTLADLDGFARKLARQGLVGATRGYDDVSPWLKRTAWAESTRGLYRSALRHARAGKLAEARIDVDTLLLTAPHCIEAVRLRERLSQGLRSPEAATAFQALFEKTERSWLQSPEVEAPLPLAPRADRPASRSVPVLAAVVAGVVVSLVPAVVLVPIPRHITVPATLGPAFSVSVVAPRDGTVDTVLVKTGQWVEPGAVLLTYDSSAAQAELATASAQASELEQTLLTQLPNSVAVKQMRALVEKATAELARAQAARDAVGLAGTELANDEVASRQQLAATQQAVDGATRQLAEARELLEAQLPDARLLELAAARAQVERLQVAALADLDVTAPHGGFVSALAAAPGTPVRTNQTLVALEDTHTLRATAEVTPAQARGVAAGRPMTLTTGGQTVETAVLDVSGTTVQAQFDNQQLALPVGSAQMRISALAKPLFTWW